MKKTALAALFTAAILTPGVASAQAIPGAVVAVVDLEKVTTQCTACKTALAALQSQANALKSRETALAAPLKTERDAIQAAVNALQGKQPDAALLARV
jgi:hypothetical protein